MKQSETVQDSVMNPGGAWSIDTLGDQKRIISKFENAGFSASAAADKADLTARACAGLADMRVVSSQPLIAFWIPGRIEVLGKHTDYAGGRSLLAATERGFCFAAAPRQDSEVRVADVINNLSTRIRLHPDLAPEVGLWTNYPATVARRLCRNFGLDKGADIAFASDLPQASGTSSSSALIVGFALILMAIGELDLLSEYRSHIKTNEDLAGFLGTIENGQNYGSLQGDKGVGTFGGSEDHTAMLCGKANHLTQYSFCPVLFERALALPDDIRFVVGYSGVVAEKTGKAMQLYNRASLLAAACADVWRRHSHTESEHLAEALRNCDGQPGPIREALRVETHPEFSSQELLNRFEHFYAESEQILPAAADALATQDFMEFGNQVERSQYTGNRLLQNQVPELVDLARSARALGATAASAFGAGFGGSVWSMVHREKADEFSIAWETAYHRQYPDRKGARFFQTQAGPPVFELEFST